MLLASMAENVLTDTKTDSLSPMRTKQSKTERPAAKTFVRAQERRNSGKTAIRAEKLVKTPIEMSGES